MKDYLGREHEEGCHFDCRIPDCGCAGDCVCESIRAAKEELLDDYYADKSLYGE